jgi:NitT/TauT family transport system permease protein
MSKSAHRPHHLRHRLHYYNRTSGTRRFLSVFISAAVLTLAVIFFRSSFGFSPPSALTLSQISWGDLALNSSFTLLRLLAAYTLSLVAALGLALLVTSHRRAEALFLPILDVLQSVPVLAFFPLAILAFAGAGMPEGAAIFILFTGMLWPILFGVVGAIHAIPKDIEDAAYNFGARGPSFVMQVLLPAAFPAIVTGSILAWGEGWNIIIVAEFFGFGQAREILPGLGSTLDLAATQVGEGNTTLFILALLTLVALVLVLNKLIWHPLLNLAERYRFD